MEKGAFLYGAGGYFAFCLHGSFKRRIVDLFIEAPRRYMAYDADVAAPKEYIIARPTVIWSKASRG